MKLECISCKTDISIVPNSVRFICPNCGEYGIVRCGKCRHTSVPYKCPKCGFEGP